VHIGPARTAHRGPHRESSTECLLVSFVRSSLPAPWSPSRLRRGNTGYGTLALELVDAPSPDVKGIFVTVETVTVHSEQAGWVTVAHGPIICRLCSPSRTWR
jgi:hypothetical protein